jgi:hypothetical protein
LTFQVRKIMPSNSDIFKQKPPFVVRHLEFDEYSGLDDMLLKSGSEYYSLRKYANLGELLPSERVLRPQSRCSTGFHEHCIPEGWIVLTTDSTMTLARTTITAPEKVYNDKLNEISRMLFKIKVRQVC